MKKIVLSALTALCIMVSVSPAVSARDGFSENEHYDSILSGLISISDVRGEATETSMPESDEDGYYLMDAAVGFRSYMDYINNREKAYNRIIGL